MNRFQVGEDGYTPFQRYRGRTYHGEICDLFECVLWKVPKADEGKLEEQFAV